MTQHPLFETFRAAEDLANLVDQQLAGDRGDQPAAAGLREATAFVMLHLVESFPRMGAGPPLQSLGKAREHLIRLHGIVRMLVRDTEQDEAGLVRLEQGVERVVTKLAYTMSLLDAGQAVSVVDETRRRSRIPSPLGLTAG